MKGVSKILAAAVACLAIPAVTQAATATYTWGTYQTASDQNFTTNVSAAIPVVGGAASVPAGSFIRFTLNGTFVGDANTAANIAGGASVGVTQPTVLGLGSFAMTITDSGPTQLSPVAVLGNSTANIPTAFDVRKKGVVLATDGSIGIGSPAALANLLTGGINAGNVDVTDASQYSKLTYGVGTPASIFTDLRYNAVSGGVVTLTPTLPLASQAFVSVGTTAAPSYSVRNAGAGDTITGPGNLIVTVTPEPTSLAVLGIAGAGLMARRRKA